MKRSGEVSTELSELYNLLPTGEGRFWLAFTIFSISATVIVCTASLETPSARPARFWVHSLTSIAAILFAWSAVSVASLFDGTSPGAYQEGAMLAYIGLLPLVSLLLVAELVVPSGNSQRTRQPRRRRPR